MTTQRGFTLIEMAIVLVIITILIGGLAMPLSAQIQARRIAETNRTLEEAREAIIGYAMSHTTSTCTCAYTDSGLDPTSTCASSLCPTVSTTATATLTLQPRHYLPCPDLTQDDPEAGEDNDGDGNPNDLNNGREDRYKTGTAAGSCASRSGNLPWVTLSTGAQDAWGNRLLYAATDAYANSSTGFPSTNSGNHQICNTSGCAAASVVAKEVPVVVLSHGPNGWGALNVNGTTLKTPTSDDEKKNINANFNFNFVSRTPSKAGDASGEFDDLVVWISDGLLRSRVCPSGGCP
jgi:prepilin-type N-terminal cleavage/methylation domain-containing protein